MKLFNLELALTVLIFYNGYAFHIRVFTASWQNEYKDFQDNTEDAAEKIICGTE